MRVSTPARPRRRQCGRGGLAEGWSAALFNPTGAWGVHGQGNAACVACPVNSPPPSATSGRPPARPPGRPASRSPRAPGGAARVAWPWEPRRPGFCGGWVGGAPRTAARERSAEPRLGTPGCCPPGGGGRGAPSGAADCKELSALETFPPFKAEVLPWFVIFLSLKNRNIDKTTG